MSQQQQQICEQIKDGMEKFLAGKMDSKTFDEFVARSNKALDALAAEKKRKADEDWYRYSLTFV